MLSNPFTPSTIVSVPGDFFGRREETRELERALHQGSVVIFGTIGIGKSSLLAHIRLHMEGFGSNNNARTVVAVGNRDVETVDDVARLLLEEFVEIDEKQKTVQVKFPKLDLISWQSTKICRYFETGRHLSVLQRVLDCETLKGQTELFILAVDEGDKCPVPLARFIKNLATYLEHQGITNVRFLVAGISPFFESMVKESPGVARIFYKKMPVLPLLEGEATELVEEKFNKVVDEAKSQGLDVQLSPDVVERVVQLSGGHPHLLQLLGSHLIEHEDSDPDGNIDSHDLYGALQAICYRDRAWVYDDLLHSLELNGNLVPLQRLLRAAGELPTRIDKEKAQDAVDHETLKWLVDHDILYRLPGDKYQLNDEFLRVRLIMDEKSEARDIMEERLIESGSFEDEEADWPESSWQEGSWQEPEEYEE